MWNLTSKHADFPSNKWNLTMKHVDLSINQFQCNHEKYVLILKHLECGLDVYCITIPSLGSYRILPSTWGFDLMIEPRFVGGIRNHRDFTNNTLINHFDSQNGWSVCDMKTSHFGLNSTHGIFLWQMIKFFRLLPWFTMVYHGLPWFTMVFRLFFGGLPWFTPKNHEPCPNQRWPEGPADRWFSLPLVLDASDPFKLNVQMDFSYVYCLIYHTISSH